jgi:hypothetical protein
MSTSVPEFLVALLDGELRKMQESLLKRVAVEYNLDEAQLIAKMLPQTPLHIVPDNVHVVRKMKPKVPPTPDERCQARIWNRGKGGQCTRHQNDVSKLCTHHHKEYEEKGHLRHGWIHDTPNKEIFGNGKRTKALYIT